MSILWPSPAKALTAAMVVWLTLLLGAAAALDGGEARVALLPLAGCVVAVAVWRPLAWSGPACGVVAALCYVALRASLDGTTGLAVPAALALLGLAGGGLVGDALARSLDDYERQRLRDTLLIEELTPTAGITGVLKPAHVQKELSDEVERARRYKHDVALALIAIQDWGAYVERAGADQARAVLDEVAQITIAQVRATDAVGHYDHETLQVIMPHTPLEGAQVAVEKVRLEVRRRLGQDLRAGLALYPRDAQNADVLLREAAAALEFATMSGLSVVTRGLLSGA